MKFDFGFIKKSLSDYASSLKKLRAEIEQAEREREDILFAPPTKADAHAAMVAWVESQAALYRASILDGIKNIAGNRRAIDSSGMFAEQISRVPLIHQKVFAPVDGPVSLAMCALMGDALVNEFDTALAACSFEGAIPAAERTARLESIDARLAVMRADERNLVAAASEVGVNVDQVE